MVVRAVVQALVRSRVIAGARARAAGVDLQGTADAPLGRDAVRTVGLDLVRTVVRQRTVGADHQLRQIPVLGHRNVGLTARAGIQIRCQLAFGIAVVACEGVVHLAVEPVTDRAFQEQVKRVVPALELGQIEFGGGVGVLGQRTVGLLLPERVAYTRIEDEAAAPQCRRAGIIDRTLEVAVGHLGPPDGALAPGLFHTDDELILVMRFQVDRGNRARIGCIAALQVGGDGIRVARAGVSQARVDRNVDQPGRRAVRSNAGIREVLHRIQRAGRGTDGHVVGQGQVITARIGEQLQRSIATDIPYATQARCPLVVLLDVYLIGAGEVLEGLVAQAQRQQDVVADLPTVLEELRGLFGFHLGDLGVVLLANVVPLAAEATSRGRRTDAVRGIDGGIGVVGTAVDPDEAAAVLAAGVRLCFHDVQAGAQVMVAQAIAHIQAPALGFIVGAGDVDRGSRPAAGIVGGGNAGCTCGGRGGRARAGRIVAPRILAVIDLLGAVQRRHREVIGQIAGVLADV
ncbi:hypothetical protein D3C71_1151920 [compost metagenome]